MGRDVPSGSSPRTERIYTSGTRILTLILAYFTGQYLLTSTDWPFLWSALPVAAAYGMRTRVGELLMLSDIPALSVGLLGTCVSICCWVFGWSQCAWLTLLAAAFGLSFIWRDIYVLVVAWWRKRGRGGEEVRDGV